MVSKKKKLYFCLMYVYFNRKYLKGFKNINNKNVYIYFQFKIIPFIKYAIFFSTYK